MKSSLTTALIINTLFSFAQFGPSTELSWHNPQNLNYIRIGDLDNDGLNDITVAFVAQGIFWIKNLGDNKYAEPILIADDVFGSNHIEFEDLDSDGDLDLVYTNYGDYNLYSSYNLGAGVFDAPTMIYDGTSYYTGINIDDIDDDGDLDISCALLVEDRVVRFENLDGTNFSAAIDIGAAVPEPRYL
ncbi:MAG: hypothetical protein ACI8ZM_004064, partial [Crocinitomix sp.]